MHYYFHAEVLGESLVWEIRYDVGKIIKVLRKYNDV